MRKLFETYGAHGARLLLIVVVAVVVRAVLNRAVRRLVRSAVEGSVPVVLRPLTDRARALDTTALLPERRRQRTETLGSVLRSIVSFGVVAVAGAMALSRSGSTSPRSLPAPGSSVSQSVSGRRTSSRTS